MSRASSWPVGLRVWVAHNGEWRTGLIESRPHQSAANVRLDSGELVVVGFNRGHVQSRKPTGAVPRSKRVTSHTGVPNLFIRDEKGRMVRRNPEIWSTKAPACLDCGTTEKPHECKGYCASCYQRWKRRTDPKWRARINQLHKQNALRRAEKIESYDKQRVSDPKRREQRRIISRRYAQKFAKWPVGCMVETPLGNFDLAGRVTLTRLAAPWSMPIRGVIESTTNASAMVRFGTFAARVPFARLRRLAQVAS